MMFRYLKLFACLGVAACHSSAAVDDDAACGTLSAKSQCLSDDWPRLALVFGDRGASNLTYRFRSEDGTERVSQRPSFCDGNLWAAPTFHCDVPYFASPTDHVITVEIDADAGDILLSSKVELMPFNRCGKNVAQVIVTTIGDGGLPSLSDVLVGVHEMSGHRPRPLGPRHPPRRVTQSAAR